MTGVAPLAILTYMNIYDIDPEPIRCHVDGRKCGYENEEKERVESPRRTPEDYLRHELGCMWAFWAMRELARNDYKK